MLELALWILFGSLCGWIGYLATRSNETHAKPYLMIGVAAAIAGGLLTTATGGADGSYSINLNSLVMALMTSALCMIAFGFFAGPIHTRRR